MPLRINSWFQIPSLVLVHSAAAARVSDADELGGICELGLVAKGVPVLNVTACCTLALSALPHRIRENPSAVVEKIAKFHEDGICGGTLGNTAALVQKLNAAYNDFEPHTSSTSFGVAYHITTTGEELWNTKSGECSEEGAESDGFVSISYLNKAVSAVQEDWYFVTSLSAQDHLNAPLVCMDLGGADATGVILTAGAVEASMRCAYAVKASTEARPNGCGCTVNAGDKTHCVENTEWICPASAGCNKDPETRDNVTADSPVLRACMCTEVDQHPVGNTAGDARCVWEGPRFFGGLDGKNQLREMMEQQYNGLELSRWPWNEVVLSGGPLNECIKRDPAAAISAVVMPLPLCWVSATCREQTLQVRERLGSPQPIPIVGFNLYNPDAPFVVLDANLS